MRIPGDGFYSIIREYEKGPKGEAPPLRAYWDAIGKVWTVGWGSTGSAIGEDTVITAGQAEVFLRQHADMFANAVRHAVHVPLSQNQFDAVLSIVYNVGPGSAKKSGIIVLKDGKPSTLLRKLNAGDYAGASAEFPKWCSPGTAAEGGLKRRRLAEQRLFNLPDNDIWFFDPR